MEGYGGWGAFVREFQLSKLGLFGGCSPSSIIFSANLGNPQGTFSTGHLWRSAFVMSIMTFFSLPCDSLLL